MIHYYEPQKLAVARLLQAEPAVRETRLSLTEAVSVTLKNGLGLLGIESPKEM